MWKEFERQYSFHFILGKVLSADDLGSSRQGISYLLMTQVVSGKDVERISSSIFFPFYSW